MLDVKYHKDYRHNYLIIKDNGSLSGNLYQRKMVAENKIKGLLPTSEKNINGEVLLYYEITSRQSIQSIYSNKTINLEQLKDIFVQLKVVNDNLQKYLLDGSCLVLFPEYIFQNIETGEMYFLYYPELGEESLTELINFFVSRVCGEDMEAVEIIYKIADLIHREQFVLDEVLKWFQDDLAEIETKKNMNEFRFDEKTKFEERIHSENADFYNDTNNIIDNEEVEINTYSDRNVIKILPAIIFAAIGAGALAYIGCFYQLSYSEQIYVIVGWGIIISLLLGSGIWYLLPRIIKGKRKDELNAEGERPLFMQTGGDLERNVTNNVRSDVGNRAEDSVGDTVFIPWMEGCENKLYGVDKRNKQHIDLGKLPITIGKLAGAVDMVINEQSISRMHARFTKAGNRIYITDLNSTNGTYRNGMRLEPNASEIIEPGDEIRLGKLKFIYR